MNRRIGSAQRLTTARSFLCFVLIGAGVFSSPLTAQIGAPSGLGRIDAPPLLGEATRAHLLGLVDLYTIALYAPRPFDQAEMVSADVPKVLRIQVAYEPDLRRPALVDWQRELVPRLQPAGVVAHLRGTFAALKRDDVVLIEYMPGKGTAVRVNRLVAVSGANHELMLAFLDHWLGQRPVSEEIKRRLLGTSSARLH
jgi:Chalcone isomerase-like